MKKMVLVTVLMLASMAGSAQKTPKQQSNLIDYNKLSLKEIVALYKNDKTNVLLINAFTRYHEISEEKFMIITNAFWKRSEIEYKLFKKEDIKKISEMNDNTDPDHSYKYIKFNPSDTENASNITPNFTDDAGWDKTSSCYLIDLFDLLLVTMQDTDVLLLTKGYEFIPVLNSDTNTLEEKPYVLKKITIAPFMILNSNLEAKGFYDISKDPGL